MRRDRHAPAVAGGYAIVFEDPLQLRPILRGDPLHYRLDLALEMCESDSVG